MCLSNKFLGNADAALWDLILRTTALEKCVPMRLLSKETRIFCGIFGNSSKLETP